MKLKHFKRGLVEGIPVCLRKDITNTFVRSFLYYVPYACLAAMTFPAILSASGSIYGGIAGFVIALYLSYKEKSLLTVALSSCAVVFVVERIVELIL